MDNKSGIRDIYQASIKTLTPLVIGGRNYPAGATLLYFNNIQELSFTEDKESVYAHGGWNDRNLVEWEITHFINCAINLGVVSKLGYGLINKTSLQEGEDLYINQIENLEADEGRIETLHPIDSSKPISIFTVVNGSADEEILEFTVEGNTIILGNSFDGTVIVDYWYYYQNGLSTIDIGRRDLNGFLMFTGKFYYVDEYTGVRKTGLIEIPKLRIESDFSIRLGRNTNPFISILNFEAIPDGERGKGIALKIHYLNEDLDADL